MARFGRFHRLLAAVVVTAPAGAGACGTEKNPICYLCDSTPSPLAGAPIVWQVDPTQCTASGPPPGTRRVLSNAIITGNSDHPLVGGTLLIAGSGIRISGISVAASIEVSGQDVSNLAISDVHMTAPEPLLRLYTPVHGPALLDASDLSVQQITLPPPTVAYPLPVVVAMAFTRDAPMDIQCVSPSDHVVIQTSTPMTGLITNCVVADLGQMLGAFGSRYEVLYNNWDYVPESGGFGFWVVRLIGINVVLAIVVGMCVTAPPTVSPSKKED